VCNRCSSNSTLLYNLKEDISGRTCSLQRGSEKSIQNLAEKPHEKRPFGKPKHKWKNTIKMDLDCTGSEYSPMSVLFEHENETLSSRKIGIMELP
jgi:hypothetical protein